MKQKCSFILKASTALVLALLMLFGTVTTSIAAVVDNAKVAAEADKADTGAKADLAETGASRSGYAIAGVNNDWTRTTMTPSDGGYYCYYEVTGSKSSGSQISFAILNSTTVWDRLITVSNFDTRYANDNFWNSGALYNDDSLGWSWANNPGDGDRIYFEYKNNKKVYIVLYYPNTELNTYDYPKLTYYNTLPDDTATYYLYNNFANGSSFNNTSLGTTSKTNWDTKTYSTSITMPTASHNYAFKLRKSYGSSYADKGDDWYGNTGTITGTISGWNFKTNENTSGNTTITSGAVANQSYTFSITDSNWHDNASFEQVTLAVTYPTTRTITVNQYKGTSGTTAKAGTVKIGDTSVTTNGGTASVLNSTDTYVTITAPTGYTISTVNCTGWTKDNTNSTAEVFKGTLNVSANQTMTVRYVPKTSTVTLNKNASDATAGTPSVTATYDANMPSATMPTRTGYTFAGYYDTDAATGGTQYYTAAGASARTWNKTGAQTLYARWTVKTSALTFDYATNGGNNSTRPTGKSATYGAAMPAITSSQLPAARAGYTFLGIFDAASGGTQYYTAAGASARNWDKDTTSGTTLYAQWSEVTGGVALQSYTNGASSTTGGHIENGSGTTITSLSDLGISTSGTAVSVVASSSYSFAGWQFDGTNYNKIRYSLDNGTSWNTPSAQNTTVGNSSNTTILIRTNGESGLTTSNAIVRAMFVTDTRTVTVGKMLAVDGTGYSTTAAANETGFNPTLSGSGTYSISSGQSFNPTTTDVTGYKFIGWIKSATALTSAALNTTPTKTTLEYGSTAMTSSVDTYYYALYKKIYYVSAYDSYELKNTSVSFITAPPKGIEIKRNGATVVTYSYSGTATKGNPYTGTDASSAGGTANPSGILDETGTAAYGAGNYITVLAGDEVTLKYSALASSDAISGIFYWNGGEYNTTAPSAGQFVSHVYTSDRCLYADAAFYTGATATTISGQDYAIDAPNQTTHTVSWIATSDYKNIDIELATKKQFIFVDDTGAVIQSEKTDNYYTPGYEVSASSATTKFGVKLDTSDTCTYAWGTTGAKATFWQDAACTVAATGISLSSSATNGYYIISGTMPNYDVYVKLNIETKFNIYLGGRMVADTFQNYDSFGDVATYTGKDSGGATRLTGLATTANAGPHAVTKGETGTVTFTYTFTGDNASKYSFLGWYKGDSTGPDYANGKLSAKQTFTLIPKEHTYIYAVGTRDVYINGSKNITGADSDWNIINNVNNNFKMEFDPDFVNTDDGGARGRYYWVVKESWFNASGTGGVGNFQMGSYQSDSTPYWNDNNNPGSNSFFQFLDSATGDTAKTIWSGIEPYISTKDYIKFGKINPRDKTDQVQARKDGLGTIKFKESDYPGYSAPITIYYYPGRGFSVEPTPIYSNLYVSNGYTVGGTLRTTNTTVTVPTGEASFTIKSEGTGWNPDHEGHVQHYIPQKKNAKVRISKTCSANEKVVAFDVYDLDNDRFYSITDVKAGTSNSYYIDFQCTLQQNIYIIPIIEEKSADLNINFDGTQLNKAQWGEIVTAYAWYSDGSKTPALGTYPGQPMVVSDDGNTWTAKMPSTKVISGTTYHLAGILFTNDVDGIHSWLGCTDVMGSVSDHTSGNASGGLINVYNHITGTETTYSRTNFKAQTYDYREPVAIYENEPKGEGIETTITFAMKDGDSSLISWKHSDFTGQNILNPPSGWSPLRWEYLTNSTGKKYADLNGSAMETKPTATFYVASKGQVIYKNSALKNVFYGGKSSDGITGVTYGGATGVDFNYAVQWYIYDAEGNYITTTLSAGIADISGSQSYIAKVLTDMGYAVEGKSVAICYDKPRYMYTDDNNVINSGANFDAYRFEGQWYATVKTEPVTLTVGVGMMTENGEVLATGNTAGYGNAYARYDTTNNTAAFPVTNDGTKSVTVALADSGKRIVKLDADATNFVGWYYYDANTGEFTKATYTSNENFYPNFNSDTTYYAMYEARAVYQYNYTGREGNKSYSVDGGELSDTEMSNGNKVSTSRSDFGTKAPGADKISVFKKTFSFDSWSAADNTTPYILQKTITPTVSSFTLTYYYPASAGGDVVTHSLTQQYNTTVDLSSCNVGNLAGSGKVFMGWYEYDPTKSGDARYGKLLTTQANYGFVMTKDQTVAARYGDAAASDSGWEAFIDDNEVNKEMTGPTSGTYYNDTIVRFRNGTNAHSAIPNGAEVGVLIINDGGSGLSVAAPEANLKAFVDGLNNGQRRAIGTGGRYVVKFCQTEQSPDLSYYNRTDFSLRSDYAATTGSKYNVYAYLKVGSTYYFSAATSGTYN